MLAQGPMRGKRGYAGRFALMMHLQYKVAAPTVHACLALGVAMPWGRVVLAVLVTALVGWAYIALFLIENGRFDAGEMGLSEVDRAALLRPVEQLVAGEDEDLLASFAPGGDPVQLRASIDQLQALIPAGETAETRITNWRVTTGTGGNWLTAIAEHEFRDHVARSETLLTRAEENQPWLLYNLNLNVAPRSEIPDNAITLSGRPPAYIAMVTAALILPPFMLATFWAALFLPRVKPRWAWVIAVIIGVGTFQLNGTTGEIGFQAASINLFGAGAMSSGSAFDPWIISVAHPIGAVVFWVSRLFVRTPAVVA